MSRIIPDQASAFGGSIDLQDSRRCPNPYCSSSRLGETFYSRTTLGRHLRDNPRCSEYKNPQKKHNEGAVFVPRRHGGDPLSDPTPDTFEDGQGALSVAALNPQALEVSLFASLAPPMPKKRKRCIDPDFEKEYLVGVDLTLDQPIVDIESIDIDAFGIWDDVSPPPSPAPVTHNPIFDPTDARVKPPFQALGCCPLDEAAYQLVNIILQSKIPLYYYEIILEWGDLAADSGLIGKGKSRKGRKAIFDELVTKYCPSKVKMVPVVLESDKPATLELDPETGTGGHNKPAATNRSRVTGNTPRSTMVVDVPVFEFKSQLMDLLSDELFHDLDNLVVNRTSDPTDLFRPYQITPGVTMVDEVLEASWYQETVVAMPQFDPENEYILPIITYGDGTPVDKMGKHSVEPWIFSLAVIRQSARNLPSSWRMMGMRPDLDSGSKVANSRSDGGRKGRSMRNGHACLNALLQDLLEATKKGFRVNLRLGNHVRTVTVRPVHAFTIGDAKSGDFIAGRYGGHNTQRICRGCYCEYELSDHHDYQCNWVEINHILPLLLLTRHFHDPVTNVESLEEDAHAAARCLEYHHELLNGTKTVDDIMQMARKELEHYSQHESISPFMLLNLQAGDKYGVFRSTPTDYMHAFLLGVLKYSIENILREFPLSGKADIDITVAHVALHNRQTAKNDFPRANLVRGVTNLAKVTADEWAGLAFYLYLYLLSPTGKKEAIKHYARSRYPEVRAHPETHHVTIVRVLENLLVFEAWLKCGPFGTAGYTEDSQSCSRHIHERMNCLMGLVATQSPRQHYDQRVGVGELGNGWKLQKFHEHLHLPWLIHAFGHPRNYNAAQGESHLKYFAKLPAATVQKTSPQILVKQIAERAQMHIAVGKMFRVHSIIPIVQSYKEWHHKQAPAADVHDYVPSDVDSVDSDERTVNETEEAEESEVSGHLWTMTLTKNNKTKSSPTSCKMEFPSRVSKHENAIYPQTEEYVSTTFSKKLLEQNDTQEIVVRGYSVLRRAFTPRIRAHPSFSHGRSWHDWIMAHFVEEKGDVKLPGPSKRCKAKCKEVSRLFGLHNIESRVVNMQGSSKGTASTLAGVWPVKVLGIIVFTEKMCTGDNTTTWSKSVCRLLIHSSAERMTTPYQSSLVTECWRMELDEEYLPNIFPKLRLIDPSSIVASVYVYDPQPSNPFVLSLFGKDKEKYVYTIFDRLRVWPSQFLLS